jgi:hypothetical protein
MIPAFSGFQNQINETIGTWTEKQFEVPECRCDENNNSKGLLQASGLSYWKHQVTTDERK